MKQLIFLVSAFYLLSIISCTKDDDTGKNKSNIPNWSVCQYNDQNIGTNEATPTKSLLTGIWFYEESGDILGSPVVYDGKMYFGDGSYFYCLEAK